MNSERPGEGPIPEVDLGDVPKFFEALTVFDEAQAAFHNACREYAADPSESNLFNLGICGSSVARTFKESVHAIMDTEDNSEIQIDSIANLMIDEDFKRSELLRNLSGCSNFVAFSSDEYGNPPIEMVKKALLNTAVLTDGEEFIHQIGYGLAKSLEGDLNHLVQHVDMANPNQTPQPEKGRFTVSFSGQNLLDIDGKKLLDAAKFGAGVAAVIWLMGRRKK